MFIKKTITKIKLTKEQQEEVDSINKGENITRVTMATRKSDGSQYEFTTKRPLTKDTAHKRMCLIYGNICTGCGFSWPDYKVLYDYDGAVRIERYCKKCYQVWKDRL